MSQLIQSILTSAWMIDYASAYALVPQVARLLEGKKVNFDQVEVEPILMINHSAHAASELPDNGNQSAAATKIAVLSIKGVLTKNDQFCGPEGTESINRRMQGLIDDKSVDAIVLDMDTPGGQASFLDTLSNTIKASTKPVVAYYSSQCASAGYYIASSADEIYASEFTDIVGSIGTVWGFLDMRGAFEKAGIKIHEVYADQSSEKNLLFKNALDGDYKMMKEEILNPFTDQFIAAVKEKREISDEKTVFKGGTFMSKEATSLGLIDGVKTLEQVIERAALLVAKEDTNDNKKSEMKNKFTTVAALLGYVGIETKDGMISLSVEDMEKIENKISSTPDPDPKDDKDEGDPPGGEEEERAASAELKTQNKELNAKVIALTSSVNTKDAEIAGLKTQVEEYGGQAAAEAATAAAAVNEFEQGDKEKWSAPDLSINEAKV